MERKDNPVVPIEGRKSRVRIFVLYVFVTIGIFLLSVQIASDIEGRSFFDFSSYLLWTIAPFYFGFGKGLWESLVSLAILGTFVSSISLSLKRRKVLPFLIFFVLATLTDLFIGYNLYVFRNA